MYSLALLFVFVFFSPFSIVIPLLGEESRSMCFLCICCCFFILHTLFFSYFSSSLCQGLAVTCDCGTPWTFLLTFVL